MLFAIFSIPFPIAFSIIASISTLFLTSIVPVCSISFFSSFLLEFHPKRLTIFSNQRFELNPLVSKFSLPCLIHHASDASLPRLITSLKSFLITSVPFIHLLKVDLLTPISLEASANDPPLSKRACNLRRAITVHTSLNLLFPATSNPRSSGAYAPICFTRGNGKIAP